MRRQTVKEVSDIKYDFPASYRPSEKPEEKILLHGAGSLSALELIAILIQPYNRGTDSLGTAAELMKKFGSLRRISGAAYSQLAEFPGVGQEGATALLAGLELGRKVASALHGERTEIHGPDDIFELLKGSLRDEQREHFIAVFLNTKNVVTKITPISIGLLDASLVNPRELFREAILEGAASIIVAHNHPSGDPEPSAEDRSVTRRLVDAGKLLGLPLIDHIIIGEASYVSLKGQGLL